MKTYLLNSRYSYLIKKPLCKNCGSTNEKEFEHNRKNICHKCRKEIKRIEGKKAYKDPIKRKFRLIAISQYRQNTIENFLRSALNGIKTRHRERNRNNINCNITLNDLLNLWYDQDGKCSVTGIKMIHCFKNLNSVSVDRIDNLSGYILSNIRLVCKWINTGRLNNNINDFNEILLNYANNLTDKNEYNKDDIRSYFRRILRHNVRSRCSASKLKSHVKNYNLTLDFLCDMFYKQNGKCIFTNQQMLIEQDKLNSCSVDRIDNSYGYMKDNVHLVCSWTNTARGPHTIDEFKNVLNKYKYNILNKKF